ncbi:Crp/Fnr family transcriptional regulator [Albidovulum sp.]|uniref:Crp/Fnr family transcriptional regulator n=1 Tax=Albidovulum sp. TaxID=1872424 RepID=UPI001D8B3C4B|nr:Crp/Fnr family transcriptional regulator [Paracoccaceae bacterium]MCB2139284.1 Crp/Fnr family transcriptional regulator [Paracoccaceae bacterium]MCB2142310.1 Crp/Fnr family transcriptional regulator [Paracoccaceae bacterium]MCB2159733.1 Crp/Fnr family transcriptional regulator [Paracoccaceae bacterium]MCO5126063.1 Crp/Fnr family transcriptional regulator [Paracoccaceae bacterium]
MKPEVLEAARRATIFRGMSEDVLTQVLSNARTRTVERGATLFLQGERATAIYIVLDGWVKLYRIAPNGTEAVVGVFTRGRSIGEAVAFRHDVYPVSAEAVTDCEVLRVEADHVLRLLQDNPGVAVSILAATFAHLHGLVEQIEQLKAQTGAQRVAEFLLELSDCSDGACTVTLPYDKVLIAGRLGMKPESLSRAFAKLRSFGVSVHQNHAKIADLSRLRDYAEEDPALAWNKGQ